MATYDIGELAEKYETSNRGPGFISNGDKWDPGGDSYGSYQLATKVGTLQGYLKTSLPYVNELKKYKIKTAEFNALWKDIAKNDPIGFKQSQFDYVSTISYAPCRKYADGVGIKDTLALNSALFSTSNQSGGWKKIIDKANISKVDSEETQVNKLYDARAKYFKSLPALLPKVKESVMRNRCGRNLDLSPFKEENERKDCLALVTIGRTI